ncbi:MAG: cysteine desulfurase family protein [Candidatus Sulfobium sp.]
MIYLDNNATTPVDPEVSDAIFSSLKRDFANPSSSHLSGRKAKELVESCRFHVAEFLGARHEEIVFTSGGTESNNLALLGTALFHGKGHIVTSVIEHPSVLNTCRHLQSLGFEVTYVPVDHDGIVDLEAFGKSIRPDTILVSIMHANNETGVIQPVGAIRTVAEGRGVKFHSDAAQSVGKMHFEPAPPPADLMTIVGHKFYGPKGVGALYVKTGTRINPILFGAGHERGLRPGTENVAGIVGLEKACLLTTRDIELRVAHTSRLRDVFLEGLMSEIPGLVLNGHKTRRLPNTLNVRIPGIYSGDLVEKIGDRVAVSTGSACHSGRRSPSSVLKHMGLSDEEALSSVRLSLGKGNTDEEIREAVGIISAAVRELREKPLPAATS